MARPIRRVLVVGAGGHARVCLEALADDPDNRLLGCVSRDGTGLDGLPVPVLGADEQLEEIAMAKRATHAFVAVGENRLRAVLAQRCLDVGLHLVTATSHFAHVSPTARIGGGVALLPGAVVNAAAELHAGVVVNTNASVDHDCIVGEYAHLAPAVAIAGGVAVGAEALLGIGARVIPGITIGERAVVGAGAVVVHDVPSGMTVVGSPARPIKRPGRV